MTAWRNTLPVKLTFRLFETLMYYRTHTQTVFFFSFVCWFVFRLSITIEQSVSLSVVLVFEAGCNVIFLRSVGGVSGVCLHYLANVVHN